MDYQAVIMSSAEDLEQMGYLKGDAMNLKYFAQSQLDQEKKKESTKEKKQILEDILSESQGRKRKSTTTSHAPASKQTRKVTIGWLHYDESIRSFKQIKSAKGGGVCVVDLALISTYNDMVSHAKALFFQDDHSFFGYAKDMDFGLANFQRQTMDEDDNFTLQFYIEKYQRKPLKLFLTSRKRAKKEKAILIPDDDKGCYDSDWSGSEFDSSAWHTEEVMKVSDTNDLDKRRELITSQDKEFEESLKADQAKRQRLMEEEQAVKRQHDVMYARKGRVPEEPGAGEPSVLVRIRHLTLGLIEYHFRPTAKMSAVYDWVGGQSFIPENFVLKPFGVLIIGLFSKTKKKKKCTDRKKNKEVDERGKPNPGYHR